VNLYDQVWKNQNYCPNGLDRAREVLDELVDSSHAYGWSVVDVGCGRGHVVAHLRGVGIHAVGIDPFLPDDAPHCLRSELGNLLALNATAEVVTSFDVLEHLSEDAAFSLLIQMGHLAPRCVMAIANMEDIHEVGGRQVDLHMTKQPAAWWQYLMHQAGWRNLRIQPLPYPERFFIWAGPWP